MKDDVLGELSPSSRFPEVLDGSISFEGKSVSLSIDPDGGDIEATLSLARQFIPSLSGFDRQARTAAAKDLLETYNENWREYQEAVEDGKLIDVSNPMLSEDEFVHRIKLGWIRIVGDSLCELGYEDGRLFAGHSIVVTSFDGVSFKDLNVELFG